MSSPSRGEADAALYAQALSTRVSENRPDRPSLGRALAAVGAKRNVAIGLLAGTALAAALFLVFVVPGETQEVWYLYLALAFVVAVTSGALVAILLTIGSAVRVSQETDSG